MVDELLEKDVVRPEQENPVSLPVPTERVLKVREGCQGPRIGGRRIEQDCFKKVSGVSGVRAHGETSQGKRYVPGPKKKIGEGCVA